MKLGISEVIAEIGSDNLEYQLLSKCMSKFKVNKKYKDHDITFSASMDKINSGKQAVIIWCDNDELERAATKIRQQQGDKQ